MITTEQVREALGQTAESMTDGEILKLMATLDYLSDIWLDKAEIEIFGKTVKDIVDTEKTND